MTDVEAFKRRLEETGEDKVRERLATGVYGSQERPIVCEWLSSKEKERHDQEMTDSLDVARSARRAAWVSAICATISTLAAIVALLR